MMRQDLARAMESLTPEGVSYRIAAPAFLRVQQPLYLGNPPETAKAAKRPTA